MGAIERTRKVLVSLSLEWTSNREFLKGVSRYVSLNADWKITFVSPRELSQLEDLPRPDAIIAKEEAIGDCERLFGRDLPPLAVFGRLAKPACDRFSFCVDDEAVGEACAHHYLGLGKFAAYAFYAEPSASSFVVTRFEGFRRTLRKAGIEVARIEGDVVRALAALPKPLAVFCACDRFAASFLEICRGQGLVVPRQVSVIGADNDEIVCGFARPLLSSVRLPHEQLGFAAAEALERRMRSGRTRKAFRTASSEMRIISRGSSAPLPPAVHLIQNAIEFITDNANRPIRTADVAKHLGVSRQLLELRFREFGNETLLSAITRIRLGNLCRALRASVQPVGAVSRACGYENLSYVKTLFRRRFGMTMTEFRSSSVD